MDNNTIPLMTLPLRPSSLQLLHQQHGLDTLQDVMLHRQQAGTLSVWAAELDISPTEAARLWKELQPHINGNSNAAPAPKSAAALLADLTPQPASNINADGVLPPRQQHRHVLSFCQALDRLLGGGFEIGTVTEVCGAPGAGKTQLMLQLCVNALLPHQVGGVQGQVIVVDSEGMVPERLHDMAVALVQHVSKGAARRQLLLPPYFSVENVLRSVHVYRVHDLAAQLAVLECVEDVLQEAAAAPYDDHPVTNIAQLPFKLLVVDSMAFHVRAATATATTSNAGANAMRSQGLLQQAARLSQLARDYQLAVVVTNHMTAATGGSSGGDHGSHALVPALGEAWAHAVTTRLILEQIPPAIMSSSTATTADQNADPAATSADPESVRVCRLVKSPCLPPGQASLRIAADGIRGLDFKVSSAKK